MPESRRSHLRSCFSSQPSNCRDYTALRRLCRPTSCEPSPERADPCPCGQAASRLRVSRCPSGDDGVRRTQQLPCGNDSAAGPKRMPVPVQAGGVRHLTAPAWPSERIGTADDCLIDDRSRPRVGAGAPLVSPPQTPRVCVEPNRGNGVTLQQDANVLGFFSRAMAVRFGSLARATFGVVASTRVSLDLHGASSLLGGSGVSAILKCPVLAILKCPLFRGSGTPDPVLRHPGPSPPAASSRWAPLRRARRGAWRGRIRAERPRPAVECLIVL